MRIPPRRTDGAIWEDTHTHSPTCTHGGCPVRFGTREQNNRNYSRRWTTHTRNKRYGRKRPPRTNTIRKQPHRQSARDGLCLQAMATRSKTSNLASPPQADTFATPSGVNQRKNTASHATTPLQNTAHKQPFPSWPATTYEMDRKNHQHIYTTNDGLPNKLCGIYTS